MHETIDNKKLIIVSVLVPLKNTPNVLFTTQDGVVSVVLWQSNDIGYLYVRTINHVTINLYKNGQEYFLSINLQLQVTDYVRSKAISTLCYVQNY